MTDIILSKNGDTLFDKVKDNGNGEIILHPLSEKDCLADCSCVYEYLFRCSKTPIVHLQSYLKRNIF